MEIKLAAHALIFARREETQARFLDYIKNLDRDLNETEKSFLRMMGIDPEE